MFFQAEDGIRGLVRSRGLGDVYKRQEEEVGAGGLAAVPDLAAVAVVVVVVDGVGADEPGLGGVLDLGHLAVSYTHLTLPTSDLV